MSKVTYTTAANKLFTALKHNRNTPGPIRPIPVINLRTDKTVHFRVINESAK